MSEVELVAPAGQVELVEIGGALTGGPATDVTQGRVDLVEVGAGVVEVELVSTGTGVTGTTTATEVELPSTGVSVTLSGQQGPPGPPGPPGSSGADGMYFVFAQLTPTTVFDITHDLGVFPSVTVVDSAGNVVIGDVQYVSPDRLIVTFAFPFAGHVYLS